MNFIEVCNLRVFHTVKKSVKEIIFLIIIIGIDIAVNTTTTATVTPTATATASVYPTATATATATATTATATASRVATICYPTTDAAVATCNVINNRIYFRQLFC